MPREDYSPARGNCTYYNNHCCQEQLHVSDNTYHATLHMTFSCGGSIVPGFGSIEFQWVRFGLFVFGLLSLLHNNNPFYL